jgi:hypothetical protein
MNARKKDQSNRANPESVSDAAQRLATIVEAAEQAAASVIDDAEQQARRRLEEAEARANRLVAERLRLHADELDPPDGGEEQTRPRLRPVHPEDRASSTETTSSRGSAEAGARLLATQMAVSGASREEIAERLRSGCGIEDPGPLLEAVLGSED